MASISLSSLEIIMKVLSPNYYNFKKLSVLTQTISFLFNCAYLKKRFLNNFDSCLEYKSVSYTMVYTPCFEEIYPNIRNQSGCLCDMSFLKAGLYCSCFTSFHVAYLTPLEPAIKERADFAMPGVSVNVYLFGGLWAVE